MRYGRISAARAASLGLLAIVLCGCQSGSVATRVQQGDVEGARKMLDKRLVGRATDKDKAKKAGVGPQAEEIKWGALNDLQLGFDRGMVSLLQGDAEDAVRWWQPAKVEMSDRLVNARIVGAVTTILDDRAKQYAGLYHEYVLAPTFLALAECLSQGRDMHAYTAQAARHEHEIAALALSPLDDPPSACYSPNGLTQYVSFMFGESAGSADAELSLRRLGDTLGEDHELVRGLRSELHGHDAVLHVVQLVGVAPALKNGSDRAGDAIRLAAVGIALAADVGISEEAAIGAALPSFKVREVRAHAEGATGVRPEPARVIVSGPGAGGEALSTHMLADMRSILDAYVREARAAELTRAVTRRLIKAYAVDLAGKGADMPRWLRGATVAALGYFEGADLRSWSLLPERMYAGWRGVQAGQPYTVRVGTEEINIEPGVGDRWLVVALQPSDQTAPVLLSGRIR